MQPADGTPAAGGPARLLRSQRLFPAVPYAYAATAPLIAPGRISDQDSPDKPPAAVLYTAGACPLDIDGAVVAPGDVTTQTHQVMANLTAVLTDAGADLTCVLKTTVYVATTDRDDLSAAWAVIAAAFGTHDAPSTLVGVSVLGWPGQLVEVEAVAVLPSWDAGP